MAIDKFDIGRFEGALPTHNQTGQKLWQYTGMDKGERVYVIPAGEFSRVVIRSSIDETGYAADTGKDSIRLWLQIKVNGDWKGIKKLDTYTTRVSGWEKRMVDKMRELYGLGIKVKREVNGCDQCNSEKVIVWFVKKEGPNFNRPMAKCPMCQHMMFLDKEHHYDAVDEEEAHEEEDINSLLNRVAAQNVDVLDQVDEVIENAEKHIKSPDSQQELAIFAPLSRPIRVLAAPGSGKTFVIERRVQHLLNSGVDVNEIVVVTFSKAQSQDMADRIISLNPQIRGTDGENQICTIHAFCNRTLHASNLGRFIPQKGWEIKRYIQENSKSLWPVIDESDKNRCRPAWDEVLSAISNAKHRFLPAGPDYDMYEEFWGAYHAERLAKIRKMFDGWMVSRKEWTFADMLYDMEMNLNNNSEFREFVQNKFRYIHLDESQDTNGQAMRILATVAMPENRIFIVGDPDQLMYRFTGATPELNCYEGFDERYPDGLTFKLETNYRSTWNIIERGKDLIKNNYWIMGGPYDDKFIKEVNPRPSAIRGPEIEFTMYEDAHEEAEAVADTIVEALQSGMEPKDIFVSSRTRAQLGVLEPVFTEAGIPFINITGGSFWLLGHVQKLISWPTLLYNNVDEDAFRRICNVSSVNFRGRDGEYSPTRFLGSAFVGYCDGIYDRENLLRAGRHNRMWENGANDFVDFMDELENASKEGGHVAVMRAAMKHFEKHLRWEEGLEDSEEDIGKLADLEVVIDVASGFDTFEEFLVRVEEAIQAAKDSKNKNWDKYVVLSTVHRLKGMERPIMFGIGWCENASESTGLLPHTFSMGVKPPGGILDFGNSGNIEDERCIGYVCVTRAKDRAYLSGFRNFREKVMLPSRFAYEMDLVKDEIYE